MRMGVRPGRGGAGQKAVGTGAHLTAGLQVVFHLQGLPEAGHFAGRGQRRGRGARGDWAMAGRCPGMRAPAAGLPGPGAAWLGAHQVGGGRGCPPFAQGLAPLEHPRRDALPAPMHRRSGTPHNRSGGPGTGALPPPPPPPPPTQHRASALGAMRFDRQMARAGRC